ncbi:hypothetical protein PoB_007487200 [Plakobranchus ocellatus]|uniref:Secreted protein n=1 Tax=Plakobranchus ocellatus TaxID=259542 RepID=A0AAV4DWH3_9GAST|nr:hypothetical protein PoB_007487200 [Plakobranchus ocellatus]
MLYFSLVYCKSVIAGHDLFVWRRHPKPAPLGDTSLRQGISCSAPRTFNTPPSGGGKVIRTRVKFRGPSFKTRHMSCVLSVQRRLRDF